MTGAVHPSSAGAASISAQLRKLGVDAVVQAEFEGGVEMMRQALVQCPADIAVTARRLVSKLRKEF